MFNLVGDFSQGCFSERKVNGFQSMVMQSQVYTDALISEFQKEISAGKNPNDVYDAVFAAVGCSEADLTDFDRKRLKEKVEFTWRSMAFNVRRS